MKVIDHLLKAQEPLISFEIIPPKRDGEIGGLLAVVEELTQFHPRFIDVTSHPAEVYYDETTAGIVRRIKRKRPGTIGICAVIQHKYGIDAVPHVLCQGFTREETEDFLIELQYAGIQNALAVRGDEKGYVKPLPEGKSRNMYAVDLVRQIHAMNEGKYLTDLLDVKPTGFCIGVGGYPEKHFMAANMKRDVERLREKVDAGASYIVTQLFYDNAHYFKFVELCRAEGITVPILPGLKVLSSKKQLEEIALTFHVEIPYELSCAVESAATKEDVVRIGIDWAAKQVEGLLNAKVPAVHFYVMQKAGYVTEVLKKVGYR